MPSMNLAEFQQRRDAWESLGSYLLSREEVEKFDDFFAHDEQANQFRSNGFIRAQAGDYSQYETVEPLLKGYLGAKKCYDLFDRYKGDASDPQLQQELKERLMEADLRTGFAMGGKDPKDSVSLFLRECERIANRQMLMQTLEEPDANAKLRLLNQFEREEPATAQQNLEAALNKDLEQRVEIAKVLFMNHLGKFQVYDSKQRPMEMNENISEVYAHGGRTMFILPAGANQKQVMDGIQGAQPEQSGLESRSFATHDVEARTFKSNGSIASEAKELKVGGLNTFSPFRHKGMDASIGGLGQIGPNGKAITADGTNGHMFMHLAEGKENTCGMMLVGFENSGPGKKGRLGSTHDASAKKAGSSTFLSDKSCVGAERGGRVVDLSGLSGEELAGMLNQFETRYREAARAAQSGDTALLDACNDLLTGKQMSVGQVKGMLQSLQVPENQIGIVDQARAGHPKVEGYKPIAPEESAAIPMKLSENPQKKPFRVTECEGLVRPEPPAVMKKPSLWQRLLHQITFHSKNSYVSQYKEYQRTISDRMEAYKNSLQEYHNNLEALERGENPGGLRDAYQRAVEQAERRFGPTERRAEPPQQQQEQVRTNVQTASREVTEQLENALLDKLLEGAFPKNATKDAQENLREQFRGHIRETEGYNRMIRSGDGNISRILSDPQKMEMVYGDVLNGIMGKMEQNKPSRQNDAPQRTNEMEMQKSESGPRVMGG